MFLVVPGLVAKRSCHRLSSQSLEASGPATELGELVAFSLAVHLLLLFLATLLAVLFSLALAHSGFYPFQVVDSTDLSKWSIRHPSETVLLAAAYLSISVAAAYLLGTFTGWLRLNNPLLQRLEANPKLKRAIKHLGIFSLVEERPISFE